MPPLIKHTDKMSWIPLVEEHIDTAGLYYKSLRRDEAADRSPTILLKFDAGASYPHHAHPGGEELFILEGEITVGDHRLTAGDYLYAAPGSEHDVRSDSGCILLAIIPQEVRLTGR